MHKDMNQKMTDYDVAEELINRDEAMHIGQKRRVIFRREQSRSMVEEGLQQTSSKRLSAVQVFAKGMKEDEVVVQFVILRTLRLCI